MRVAIIGAGLQGVEALYLAHKAGWETCLIDKRPTPPASGLCTSFYQLDVTQPAALDNWFQQYQPIDLIIPALENNRALDALVQWQRHSQVPLAFDQTAYQLSSSKLRSDKLFADVGVPVPKPWPACGFPLIAKPDRGSGSQGVHVIHTIDELQKHCGTPIPPKDWVLQEFLAGPSFSLEIMGVPGNYQTGIVTGLEMDPWHDCRRVTAPAALSRKHSDEFKTMAITIAQTIGLQGIMDVEVILHDNQLKVLEIDARLPSQTPTAVYHSSGINCLELLAACFVHDKLPKGHHSKSTEKIEQAVIYEHIQVKNGRISFLGEHIMAQTGPLYWTQDFFGADEAITNYSTGAQEWVATLMMMSANKSELSHKRNRIINRLEKFCDGATDDQINST